MGKGFSDMRVGVSQATNGDTGQTVKIGFTVAIGQVGASAADKVHGHTSICIHNMVLHDACSCSYDKVPGRDAAFIPTAEGRNTSPLNSS